MYYAVSMLRTFSNITVRRDQKRLAEEALEQHVDHIEIPELTKS